MPMYRAANPATQYPLVVESVDTAVLEAAGAIHACSNRVGGTNYARVDQ